MPDSSQWVMGRHSLGYTVRSRAVGGPPTRAVRITANHSLQVDAGCAYEGIGGSFAPANKKAQSFTCASRTHTAGVWKREVH